MASGKRKFWGTVTPAPGPMLAMQCKIQEDAGLEGLFAPQVYGPPFVPLSAAAAVTQRVKLASGIALLSCVARSRPRWRRWTSTASAAALRPGPRNQRSGLERRFLRMPYGKPLDHMREVVEIVRWLTRRHTVSSSDTRGSTTSTTGATGRRRPGAD
jgi:alkanesulfonate monooxygenase SsuD/methylene tetrahydromethanopterin reductase-like flavin-dependent oxidoreductase (luciferase family)